MTKKKKNERATDIGSDGLDNVSDAQDALLEEDVRAAEERSRSVVERAQKKTHPHLEQRNSEPRPRPEGMPPVDDPDNRDDDFLDDEDDDDASEPMRSAAGMDKDRGGDRDKKDKNDFPEIPSKIPNRPTKPVPTYQSR